MKAPRPSPQSSVLTLLLACMLLYAQWVGLQHSIAHAGWQNYAGKLAATTSSDGSDTDSKAHSCIAFDAACMADALHSGWPKPITVPARLCPSDAFAFASRRALTDLPFFSHAPPSQA